MMEQIIVAAVCSAVTGLISTWGTVKALGVHIRYINEKIETLDAAVKRAHERIDDLKCHLSEGVKP